MKNQNPSRSGPALLASALAALLAHAAFGDATLDTSFNPGVDSTAESLVVQLDGRIIAGGAFTTIGGQPRNNIGRINADGSLDTSFSPGANSVVYSLALQADGKIIAGGAFTTIGGQSCNYIGRLNTDGSLDSSFNPGANDYVSSLCLQPDGRILVAGGFKTLGGQPCTNLGRLYLDGSLDTSFNPQANGSVYALALQSDGKILVGGDFTMLGGQTRNRLGRLNADGSLDANFNPGVDYYVYCLAVQADGKILVGGSFQTLGGQSRTNIGRLNPDGSLDTTFNPGADLPVVALSLQADGKIVVGGHFTFLGGQSCTNLGRLNGDGSLDATFKPGVDASAFALALQADGKVLAGLATSGFSTSVGSLTNYLSRVNNTEPATQSLTFDGSTIAWLRGGTSPEVYCTTFEVSTNGGVQWLKLGNGTRITGGWQLGGISLPVNSAIRARGYTVGGYRNSSSWFYESYFGPLVVLSQPSSRTNNAGTTASFSVRVPDGGSGLPHYQWRKEGTNLVNSGNISGAQTGTLVLSNVLKADEGGYSVLITNVSIGVTSVVARLSVVDPSIQSQPTGLVRNIGEAAILTVVATGTPPLHYQWVKDGMVLPRQTSSSLGLGSLIPADSGFYSVVVSNLWGSVTSTTAPLVVNGARRDPTFNPDANLSPWALAQQPDGKIVAGGAFWAPEGQLLDGIVRLNADGSLDTPFSPGVDGTVHWIGLQPDGKIVVAGNFTMTGQSRTNIARLNEDGSLDASFNPELNGIVYSLALQEDGKIVAGGDFTILGGQPHYRIGRINPDGSVDAGFNPEANGKVDCLAIQADGKILVAGEFTTVGGLPRNYLGRLNVDGSVDNSFNPEANNYVRSLALQADGMILVGGYFTMLSGQPREYIARFNPDGSLDTTFNPAANGYVLSLAVQADGKIMAGGSFTMLGDQPRAHIGRLHVDGTSDLSFNLDASDYVSSLVLQRDGKILVSGQFSTLAGQFCRYFGRLNNTDPATERLTLDGSAITWLRGGASPEVYRSTFEASTNGGAAWMELGEGTRIQGGWHLGELDLPLNSTIRTRGHGVSSHHNGSSWFVESVIGPMAVLNNPLSRTNVAGTTASFTVQAWDGGEGTNFYQWRKDGTNLFDSGNIWGTPTPTLVLTNVLGADQGDYSVVVSNRSGRVISLSARLTVVDPLILSHPNSLARNSGESADFVVVPGGTPPFNYQWLKDGTALALQTNSSLTLTNLAVSDAGNYSVIVSNEWGSTGSKFAFLTVNCITRDAAFNPEANSSVYTIAMQPDGKILVGGSFWALGSQTRNRIGRLNMDGSVDAGFNPGANDNVYCLAMQEDGKILVGGTFTILAGQACAYLGRLNADGSRDSTFKLAANGPVYSLVQQANGKILVGGGFTMLGGELRANIGRINSDGTLDSSFIASAVGTVSSLALQTDGKILVGGDFSTLNGQARNRIGRVNADGSLDTSFNPGADDRVIALAIQADGKIIAGGYFRTLGGQPRNRIARLNADGSLDTSFNPGASGPVFSLALQVDGRILLSGAFSQIAEQPRSNIGRLNPDGTLDATFNPGANDYVSSIALQADGKILAGGNFTTLGGQSSKYFGRLNNSDPATDHLTLDGSSITWLRGGVGPELLRISFEVAANGGQQWVALGSGTRIPGGWFCADSTLSSNSTIRARGFTTSGYGNGSSWFCETLCGPIAVLNQPLSRTNLAGTIAIFTVQAWEGGEDRSYYQWRKNGTNLVDGPSVAGAQTRMLVLTNVLGGDQGGYTVVVSNLSGSVTSVVAQLSVVEPLIVTQPASQIRNPGESATFEVVGSGTLPLNYQWIKDGIVLEDKTTNPLVLTNLSPREAGVYRVVVSNQWGSVTSAGALLTVNGGTLDSGFHSGANGGVYCLALQTDGKILVGGNFSILGSQTRNMIGRLNTDGSLDASFNPGADGTVYCLVVQEDGKMLVGGTLTMLGGQPCSFLGRLNADGSRDSTFDPGANGPVYSLALQADGKILVGGDFTLLAQQSCPYLGRINADGSRDASFNPQAESKVYCLALQPDGRILTGGAFARLGGQACPYLGRLNADGSRDISFNPGPSNTVYCLALQPDGKILVGGAFAQLGGQTGNYVGRINTDGSVDGDFKHTASGSVVCLAIQTDGKILVGGTFDTLGGQPRTGIGRLYPDGTTDHGFNPGAGIVYALALQPDGKILAGGIFSTLSGQPCKQIGRLDNTQPATQSLTSDGSKITWLRGGTSPEVSRTAFEISTNGGANWLLLGSGARIPGGWQLSGMDLASNSTVRARGHVAGAYHNGSSWLCESFVGPLVVSSQPLSRTNEAGTTASFTAQTRDDGAGTNSYQWRRNGTNLMDGGNIAGAQTAMLVLTNVFKPDEADYTVVVSNFSGIVTSIVARLNILDPFIRKQPSGANGILGQAANFAVVAAGTTPLSYQWHKDGVVIDGGTASSLSVSKLKLADAGYYHVVASNPWGSVTSTAAPLTMNSATVDTNFNPGASSVVNTLAVQADGRILAGGGFTTLGGRTRKYIGQLNPDGVVETTFDPGASSNVLAFVVQADGKILVGGKFKSLGGQPRSCIGRLNANGSADSAFNPGANSPVYSLALQPDGKILVGGDFTTLSGQTRNRIGRLKTDGSLDTSFNPGALGSVLSLALQADGKILVGGSFATLGGQSRYRIGRLNADGSLDASFSPTIDGLQPSVTAFEVQPDGKILVGGIFTMVSGYWRTNIARLNSDGSVDRTFNPGASGIVRSLELQADGKILVGGNFTTLGGQLRASIGRLNSNGIVDTTFNPGANSGVFFLTLQEDGRILAGGEFSTLGGASRIKIGRLNNTEAATQSLTFDGSAITWLRGGTSPEVSRTAFEITTNGGLNWLALDNSTRIAGGWKVEGLSLPANSTVRARGYQDGSGWTCETFTGPLVVLSQPESRTNNAGTGVTFTIQASYDLGSSNSYQWRKDGTNLVDGSYVKGVQSPALMLTNLLGADQGDFTVVITNSTSSVTSVVAHLTVVDPLIISQPSGLFRNLGESATLAVAAKGTAPNYQWHRDGAALAGQTGSSLTLTNLGAGDEGLYTVVVSNQWGCVTSTPALVDLNYSTPDTNFIGTVGAPSVYCLALQSDGKILVGGDFFGLRGAARDYIGRLNTEGSLDTSFDPGASGWVNSLLVQPDGKVLVGGNFTRAGEQWHTNIVRLNRDGSVDATFDSAADGGVESMALQADGKILVGGWFRMLCGQPRNYIGRLNTDGSLDAEFDPGADGGIYSLELQADGKILVGGNFMRLKGEARNRIGRLNADGSLDTEFDPGADGTLHSLAVQADGKILVGGAFTILGEQPHKYIGRLNPDGSPDTTFNPGTDGVILKLVIQPDGKILVGGWFTRLSGQARLRIGRLYPDGSLDPIFNPGANGIVSALLVQPDGKIVVGGGFTTLAGRWCSYIGRLNSTGGPLLPRIASSAPSLAAHEDGFGFNFTGTAGSFVVIEGSADLENWTPVRTNFLNTSMGTFRDPTVTNTPTRYYRLRVQ